MSERESQLGREPTFENEPGDKPESDGQLDEELLTEAAPNSRHAIEAAIAAGRHVTAASMAAKHLIAFGERFWSPEQETAFKQNLTGFYQEMRPQRPRRVDLGFAKTPINPPGVMPAAQYKALTGEDLLGAERELVRYQLKEWLDEELPNPTINLRIAEDAANFRLLFDETPWSAQTNEKMIHAATRDVKHPETSGQVGATAISTARILAAKTIYHTPLGVRLIP